MATLSQPAVFFDLDDTLLDHRGAARDALVRVVDHLGVSGSADSLEARWIALETVHYRRFQSGELTKREQRRARVRGFVLHRELRDDQADAAFAVYWSAYEQAWRAFPDAVPAVRRALEAGRAVGILTNGDAVDQARKVEATGLGGLGVPLLASSSLGAAKPDPQCFATACDLLGVGVDDAVLVGDSLENDVEGARAAGMAQVLLDRHGRRPGHVGLRVRSLDELEFDQPPEDRYR